MNKFNRNTENKTKEEAYKHKDDNTTASAEKLVHEKEIRRRLEKNRKIKKKAVSVIAALEKSETIAFTI